MTNKDKLAEQIAELPAEEIYDLLWSTLNRGNRYNNSRLGLADWLMEKTEIGYDELMDMIRKSITDMRKMGAEPARIIVNSRYKDFGKEYLAYDGEYKSCFGVPLVFRDIGENHCMVESERI